MDFTPEQVEIIKRIQAEHSEKLARIDQTHDALRAKSVQLRAERDRLQEKNISPLVEEALSGSALSKVMTCRNAGNNMKVGVSSATLKNLVGIESLAVSEKIVHNQAEIKSLTSLIIQKEKVIAAVEKQMAALENLDTREKDRLEINYTPEARGISQGALVSEAKKFVSLKKQLDAIEAFAVPGTKEQRAQVHRQLIAQDKAEQKKMDEAIKQAWQAIDN